MKLSDAKIKAATVPEGKKQVRLSDGGGLYVQASPKGKYWRMNYRFGIKQKTLALGVYPAVSLALARDRRDKARSLLVNGIDPSNTKKAKKIAIRAMEENSFEIIAREWFMGRKHNWKENHSSKKRDKT